MDIKELDKRQLILLTLLITFVVSIATGIVTVSLMNQMPKSVPNTINNVIQRTIEKVTTVEVPAVSDKNNDTEKDIATIFGDDEALVSIYLKNASILDNKLEESKLDENNNPVPIVPEATGQGVIISDVGLILVDSNILKSDESYKVVLNKTDFDVSVLKSFSNGFSILKISPMKDKVLENTDETIKTE